MSVEPGREIIWKAFYVKRLLIVESLAPIILLHGQANIAKNW